MNVMMITPVYLPQSVNPYGRRMSIDTLRYIVKRISNRTGIKKTIHPHQLCHSYATHMINNGAPLEVI
jgi:site-specific recombinase XerD